MYELRQVSQIKEWTSRLIRRGYFLIVVRLINQQRLMDWHSSN